MTTIQQRWALTALLVINILLGSLLWFVLFTDFSLQGSTADILLPPLVAIISLASGRQLSKLATTRTANRIARGVCYVSLAGGCLPILAFIILLPFALLSVMFTLDEISRERLIQVLPSPNGTRTAEVYFRPVGAYSAGHGRIFVRLSYPWLPFIERDIYYVGRSQADESSSGYVVWQDDNNLYISEFRCSLSISPIGWELPLFVRLPRALVSAGLEAAKAYPENVRLSQAVERVPLFPAAITYDDISADANRGIAWRSFQLADHEPSEVVAWYRRVLNEPPWSIEHEYHSTSPGWDYFCLQAGLSVGVDAADIYYVSVSHAAAQPQKLFVEFSTPHMRSTIRTIWCGEDLPTPTAK